MSGVSPARISPSGKRLVVEPTDRQEICESGSQAIVRPSYSRNELRVSISEAARTTWEVATRPTASVGASAPARLFCASCRTQFVRNEAVGISYCPMHGLTPALYLDASGRLR